MPNIQIDPATLIIPGLDNSGPSHWQSHWEAKLPDASRVPLGGWTNPRKSAWVTNLGITIQTVTRPKIVVAHSLGCLALAWWAALEPNAGRSGIVGALLVAPPDVESRPLDDRLATFGPPPRAPLPFPSILVASENDPHCSFGHARKLARRWHARLENAGPLGHINADSVIGDWPYGLYLLQSLIRSAQSSHETSLIDQYRFAGDLLRENSTKELGQR